MQSQQHPSFEIIKQAKPHSSDTAQRYLNLCLSYIEFVSPLEMNLETGRLIKLLSKYPSGLKRDEILVLFYDGYTNSSFNRQHSLKICLEKIIQRARANFVKYNLTIYFSKQDKKYILSSI